MQTNNWALIIIIIIIIVCVKKIAYSPESPIWTRASTPQLACEPHAGRCACSLFRCPTTNKFPFPAATTSSRTGSAAADEPSWPEPRRSSCRLQPSRPTLSRPWPPWCQQDCRSACPSPGPASRRRGHCSWPWWERRREQSGSRWWGVDQEVPTSIYVIWASVWLHSLTRAAKTEEETQPQTKSE